MDKKQNKCIPQNDMDCYYNSVWKKIQKANKSEISNFSILENNIDNEMYQFINDATIGQDPVLNNLVKFRDSYYRNRDNSFEKMVELVTKIQNIGNINDLVRMISILTKLSISTIFTLTVDPNFREPDIYLVNVDEISLTLKPNNIYQNMDEEKWLNYQKMLDEVYQFVHKYWGYYISDAKAFTNHISILEILFSKSILSLTEENDPLSVYHMERYDEFLKKFDEKDFWKNILGEYTKENSYILYTNARMINFIKKFIKKMGRDELKMVKDYLVYCLAREYGICTTPLLDAFNGIMVVPINQKKFFLKLFYITFGYYLQSIYESKHYNPNKNKYVYDMFSRMKSYCLEAINKEPIFGKNTKLEAIKKMEKLDMVVGTKQYCSNLSRLPQLGDNFYHNLMIINSFHFDTIINLVGRPKQRYNLSIDNDMYSFSVNAYYDPLSNLIYLPTAMLNNMFLNLDREPIINYGSIGVIIAHEMMHSFDTYGAMFDHNGHLKNWWSNDDYQKYLGQVSKIENHYRSLMLNGLHINAKETISEDMADIIGLKISFRTYMRIYHPKIRINYLSFGEKEYLKKFFKAWAQTLRMVESPKRIEHNILFSVHSPNTIRINGPFSYLEEYYQIYDVKPGNMNYLPPEQLVRFLD